MKDYYSRKQRMTFRRDRLGRFMANPRRDTVYDNLTRIQKVKVWWWGIRNPARFLLFKKLKDMGYPVNDCYDRASYGRW